MSKDVVHRWKVENSDDLSKAVTEALQFAHADGRHHPTTVYVDCVAVSLVKETLTDDSHVYNLHVWKEN